MKARLIFDILDEIPLVNQFVYGNKVKCAVREPYGKYETHYFEVDKNRMLQVYSKEKDEKGAKNPKLVGKPTYDVSGKLTAQWVRGQPFAFFLDEKVNSDSLLNRMYEMLDEEGSQLLNTGIIIGMKMVKGEDKELFEDPVLIGIGIIIIGIAALVFINLTGFEQLGADLFGRGG